MEHPHNHQHQHEHDHSHGAQASEGRVFWAMIVTGSFMLVEVVGGLLSGSLALLADAGHMLGDFVSLALAWCAFRISRKPADAKRSFGYHRFQVLAAFVNGLTLILIAVWVFYEAVTRFIQPVDVLATPMLIVGVIGLLVNVLAFWILEGGQSDNLNVQGAAMHVLGDLLGSVAAVLAAIIILTTGWTLADPLLSLVVGLLVLKAGFNVTSKSGHILLEGTPQELSSEELVTAVEALQGVINVHHVHVWALTGERLLATLHAVVDGPEEFDRVRQNICGLLQGKFNIEHCTVQLEVDACGQ